MLNYKLDSQAAVKISKQASFHKNTGYFNLLPLPCARVSSLVFLVLLSIWWDFTRLPPVFLFFFTPCVMSQFRNPDDSLCCWRNNHSLCSPSSAWLLWPQCIPLMTPHPALTCSHPKLFQHPWIFDSFWATSQIQYGELLLVRMIQSGWKPPSRPVWFHSHYLSHPQISRRGCVCTYSVAQLLQPFGL